MSETNRAVASSGTFNHDQLDPREYQALETALLQTARGRNFLDEYLRRNGGDVTSKEALVPTGSSDPGQVGGDTDRILQAVEKLHNAVMSREDQQSQDPVRMDILEMAKAIAKTRSEIKAMRTDGDDDHLSVASGEMDAIVQSTEKATNDILHAAEKIQEVAWHLRELGVDEASCEEIDNSATEIYMACSFQDLTGQRTTKVVRVLQYLEERITSMVDIWGLGDEEAGAEGITAPTLTDDRPDAHLLNGPQQDDEALGQDNIDDLLGEDSFAAIEIEDPVVQADSAMATGEPEAARRHDVPAPVSQTVLPEPASGSDEMIDEEQLKALFS